MKAIIFQMAAEYHRLDEFLQAVEAHQSSKDKAPDLQNHHVHLPTTTHGTFVLDRNDLLDALKLKRDTYKKELDEYTASGEKILPKAEF